jgi:hypothetical protein
MRQFKNEVQSNSCQIGRLAIFTRKLSCVLRNRRLKNTEQMIEVFCHFSRIGIKNKLNSPILYT